MVRIYLLYLLLSHTKVYRWLEAIRINSIDLVSTVASKSHFLWAEASDISLSFLHSAAVSYVLDAPKRIIRVIYDWGQKN